MSIRSEITKERPKMTFSRSHPDRIVINDKSLVKKLNNPSVRDDGRKPYIVIGDIWKLNSTVGSKSADELDAESQFSFIPELPVDDIPNWILDSILESKWARDRFYRGESISWRAGRRVIIKSKFSLTLSERINALDAEDVFYSMSMKSWIVTNPSLDDSDLEDIFEDYGITPSPNLLAFLEGRESWKSILANHVEQAKAKGYRPPDIFKTERTLKPYQEEAVLAQAHLGSSLLADQVGLGKSGGFICGFLATVQHKLERGAKPGDVYPLVIVTNNSLKEEAAEEIVKWKSDAIVEKLYGRTSIDIDSDVEFIVLNVDILGARLDDIMAMDPKGMVVDEAHSLKNPTTVRTKAAQSLADSIREAHGDLAFVTLASGTPYLNSPSELWSILQIIGKEQIFGDYALDKLGTDKIKIWTKGGWRWVEMTPNRAFEVRWCGGQFDKYKKWYNGGTTNSQELNRLLLDHVMIRRRKGDVLHPTPILDEQILMIEMPPEGIEEYNRIEQEFKEWMEDRARETAEEQGLTIREAIALVYNKLFKAEAVMKMTALRQEVAKQKIPGIKEWVHRFMAGDPEVTGGDPTRRKLIIFAHHRAVQEALIDDEELQRYGRVYIRAGENPQEHKVMFQRDEDTRLMICYSGAREGHTLTAAKDILLAEIPFVPSWIVQMAGRCWARLSEEYDPHEATIHYAIAPGTVDSSSMARVRLKKLSFNAVIDGEGSADLEAEDTGDKDQSEILVEMMSRGHRKIGIAQ